MRKFLVISGLSFGSWSVIGKAEVDADSSEEVIQEGIEELIQVIKNHTDAVGQVACSISFDSVSHGFVFRPREFAAVKVDLQVVE